MFGNLNPLDLMGKLQELTDKADATRKSLDETLIEETSADGKIKITVAGNNKIKSLSIDDTLLEDKEALEDYLIVTINKAMDKVSDANKNAFGFINDMKLPFNR